MKPNTLEKQTKELKPSRRPNDRFISQVASGKRTVFLISQDTRFHDSLRCLANTTGMMVVRLDATQGVVPAMRAISPALVLLDLDLPNQSAWEIADTLLQEPNCPPVILLSSFCEQFDVNTAMRADSIVDKSEGFAHVLEAAHETLSMPRSNLLERNAILRVLIRWLKPCDWSSSISPAHRFWGINE